MAWADYREFLKLGGRSRTIKFRAKLAMASAGFFIVACAGLIRPWPHPPIAVLTRMEQPARSVGAVMQNHQRHRHKMQKKRAKSSCAMMRGRTRD